MKQATYKQNIFDLAVQEYGTVEAAFVIVEASPTIDAIDEEIDVGQEYKPGTYDDVQKDVVQYLRQRGVRPTNGHADQNKLQSSKYQLVSGGLLKLNSGAQLILNP